MGLFLFNFLLGITCPSRTSTAHSNVLVAWFRDKRSEKGTPFFFNPIWLSLAGSCEAATNDAMPDARLETRARKTAFNELIPLQWQQRRSPTGMQNHTFRARRLDSEKEKPHPRMSGCGRLAI